MLKILARSNKVDQQINPENIDLGNIKILRGETQKNVNLIILKDIVSRFKRDSSINMLDLPCGSMLFLNYLYILFPKASLYGADIKKPSLKNGPQFIQMDLNKDFPLTMEEEFDLITSISGVMMFSNTLNFISNCSKRLKKGGTFIITNDNSATIIDKLKFLFLGRYRIFNPIYEDNENLTENVPIQELCRLLRTNGLTIEKIKFTSFYKRHLIVFPIAILIYPIQLLYIWNYKTKLPVNLKWEMFPFKHYFCKHYIIIARKN